MWKTDKDKIVIKNTDQNYSENGIYYGVVKPIH